MLKHADVWRGIDRLAERHGMSPSGLARRSGLDPTTFNKSKRIARDGKPRWPTTESISKILAATNSTLADFVALVGGTPAARTAGRIPIIGLAQAASESRIDAVGRPSGSGQDEIAFPDLTDPNAYALEVKGNALAPVYEDATVIVVSPAAAIRRGDRVVVKTDAGEVLVMRLVRKTARRLDLAPIAEDRPVRSLPTEAVAWMSRIVWASQ